MLYKSTVCKLERKRNFGFLDVNGKKVFFHKKALIDVEFSELEQGATVTFEYGANDKGECAINVRKFDEAEHNTPSVALRLKTSILKICSSRRLPTKPINTKMVKGFASNSLRSAGQRLIIASEKLSVSQKT
ncbi:hypothetical protein VCHA53O466_40089 [Vibrio chagasii]|nr:hypothetical protein VCHA53O466_40089 [Vibrio chagasii]